jgi:hypothetical protein
MAFNFRAIFERALAYEPFLKKYATSEQRQRWDGVSQQVQFSAEQKALFGGFRRKMNVLCMTGAWCGDCVAACPIFERIAQLNPKLIDLRYVNRAQQVVAKTPEPAPEDIRSTQLGKILVKWGVLTPERVEKALLAQEEERSQGLNVKIGDILTRDGAITEEQRDKAVAAQAGYQSMDDWDAALAEELHICGAPRVPQLVFLSEDWCECERYGERTLARYRARITAKHQGPNCSTGLFSPPADAMAADVAEWASHFERVQYMLLTSPRLLKLHGEA